MQLLATTSFSKKCNDYLLTFMYIARILSEMFKAISSPHLLSKKRMMMIMFALLLQPNHDALVTKYSLNKQIRSCCKPYS